MDDRRYDAPPLFATPSTSAPRPRRVSSPRSVKSNVEQLEIPVENDADVAPLEVEVKAGELSEQGSSEAGAELSPLLERAFHGRPLRSEI